LKKIQSPHQHPFQQHVLFFCPVFLSQVQTLERKAFSRSGFFPTTAATRRLREP